MADKKGVLKISFVNGTVQTFEYTRQEDTFSIGGRIKEAIRDNLLILELSNRTLFLPYNNILSVEVSPSPPKLPDTAIKGVREI